MIRIKSSNDIFFGALLIMAGTVTAIIVWPLRVGSAREMGAGYMPLMLSWMAIALGSLLVARGLIAAGPPRERWSWRPLAAIAAAVGLFILVERIGLVLAVAGGVLIARLGDHEAQWREAIAFAALLALFSALLFVIGLKLPFPLWPRLAF
jgi:hypothetical protein